MALLNCCSEKTRCNDALIAVQLKCQIEGLNSPILHIDNLHRKSIHLLKCTSLLVRHCNRTFNMPSSSASLYRWSPINPSERVKGQIRGGRGVGSFDFPKFSLVLLPRSQSSCFVVCKKTWKKYQISKTQNRSFYIVIWQNFWKIKIYIIKEAILRPDSF